mmetsp:Transcript_17867/g.23182  ORF Transcript_17867/g.23182 Transcript_17867/m.23182 type:complete len:83 (+) Transcript_17867:53-301(+)
MLTKQQVVLASSSEIGKRILEPQNSHLENPFVGLNAFEDKQRERFKGRDQFIQFALEKLHRKAFGEQPFLLLLGNSKKEKTK